MGRGEGNGGLSIGPMDLRFSVVCSLLLDDASPKHRSRKRTSGFLIRIYNRKTFPCLSLSQKQEPTPLSAHP